MEHFVRPRILEHRDCRMRPTPGATHHEDQRVPPRQHESNFATAAARQFQPVALSNDGPKTGPDIEKDTTGGCPDIRVLDPYRVGRSLNHGPRNRLLEQHIDHGQDAIDGLCRLLAQRQL